MANSDNVVSLKFGARAQAGRRLIPERLIEARFAGRLTQTELAERIGVSRQAVSAYEAGEKSPDPGTMLKIAAELRLPISHFTKEHRPSFGRHSANFFRKKGADTRRRNQACAVFADWLASTAFAFDHVANFPRVDLPTYEPDNASSHVYGDDEIEDIAEDVRKYFGLGLGPISNVVRLIETRGVIVCRYVIPDEKVDAFSYWSGERPFVFLSSDKKSAARSRFDVAHELGHLCLHRWVGADEIEDEGRLKQIEAEADKFAGAFLLPRKSFPLEVYSPRADSFIDLKARWKTSIQAMVYRCKDLGLFDERQTVNLYKQISHKRWRTCEPLDEGAGAIPFESPILLAKVAELVFKSGRYAVDEFIADMALADDVLEQLTGAKLPRREAENIDFDPTLK